MIHVSSKMWRIKNWPSDSTSYSDNALRLLVLVVGKVYWGLQVTSSFSIWGCILKGCFERCIFEGPNRVWRALKTSILNIASYHHTQRRERLIPNKRWYAKGYLDELIVQLGQSRCFLCWSLLGPSLGLVPMCLSSKVRITCKDNYYMFQIDGTLDSSAPLETSKT